ncbi:MAG: hypothetical protein ACRC0L_11975, partial [Angustibacter sp.]
RGTEPVWALDAGVTLMDGEIVRIVARHGSGLVRPLLPARLYRARWPAGLAVVLLIRKLRTVAVALGLALPTVLAVNTLLGPGLATVIAVLMEYAVIVAMTRAATTWWTSRALPRTWMSSGAATPAALLAPGLATCLAIVIVASLAVPLPLTVTAVLAVMPVAILLRRRSVRATTAEITLVATPVGAVPVEVLNRVIAGPDVVLLALLATSWLM